MPRFAYTAIEQASGRELQGVLEGTSIEAVIAVLKTRGLAPLEVNPQYVAELARARKKSAGSSTVGVRPGKRRRRGLNFPGSGVKTKELAVFTRQLGTLIKAGMPLLRSLEVLSRQERNSHFNPVIAALAETIRSGGTLSDGLQQYPRIFDRLYLNMVKAGEAGGVLEVVFDRLAQFLEKSMRVRGRIKSALTYPLIIVLVATGIVSALMVFVVPKFEVIFASTLKGQPLPALTQVVIGASTLLKNHALLTGMLGLGMYFLIQFWGRTKSGTKSLHGLQLHLPVLGDLFLKTAIARFTRTFGTLLSSGVPILDALRITRDTSGNVHVSAAITAVHDRVKEGDTVAVPLRATNIFPDMVPSMIEVGEETGALPEMLTRIADGYDEEVDHAVDALTSLVEPLMIVVMAFMVGTIVIALFLPIVRIIQSLG
ncbi:MAG: type II secretion system F family protein [Cephaloticoccus sp.]|nr:type II secretion system F family protein [Cephaloticoccus sp.]MCF7760233.1 type II secretion system F family protein [Cephaloticoccus sp.]